MEETKVVAENGREEKNDRIAGAKETRINYPKKIIITKKKINTLKKKAIIRTTQTAIEIKITKIASKTPTFSHKQINTRSNKIKIITINT